MITSNKTKTLNSLTYYYSSNEDALSVIRVLGPANHAGVKIISGVQNGLVNIESVNNGSLTILQRDICRHHADYKKITSLAHDQGKPIVFDLDDLLFELPLDHPDRVSGNITDALLPMVQAVIESDLVTVSSEPLKEYLQSFNENIAVIPNYLNDSLWKIKNWQDEIIQDKKITIGYMGGQSHKSDLLMVLPALKIIRDKYRQNISFHFWGIEPPEELMDVSQVDWYPPQTNNYADFVKYFQTQHADIVIAPLCDNLFNSCKSAIKYLEYSANGMPGVYSNIKPYTDIITNGEDGFLAASINDWVGMLSSLIENQDLRKNFAASAQRKVNENWLLSQNYQIQFEIYQNLVNQEKFGLNEIKPPLDMFRNLTGQYYEHLMKTQKTMQPLSLQVEEQKRIIEDLDKVNRELRNEILSYVLSKSWTLTRPFRKINTRIKKVL